MNQVLVLADAAEDFEAAKDFYNAQELGVGEYCVDSLLADVESLGLSAEFIRCISTFTGC